MGDVLTSQIRAVPLAGAESPTEVIGENPAEWQSDITFTHSLGLALDDDSLRRVDGTRAALRRAGIPVLGYPAHITLCCLDTMEGVDAALLDVGLPHRLELPSVRVLPGASGVVALCLDPNSPAVPLRVAHRLLHRRLAERGVTTFNFYAPLAWEPHVSVGFHVPAALQPEAVRIVSDLGPAKLGLAGITAWTIATDELDYILRF